MPPKASKRKAANGYRLPDPIPAGEIVTGLTKKKSWRVGKSIGVGGFGEIYLCSEDTSKNVGEDATLAMKIEPHENGPLFVEMNFYLRAAQPNTVSEFKKAKGVTTLGMPVHCGSGSHVFKGDKYRFLIMERFGKDLQKIFQTGKKKFPPKAAYTIAIKVLDTLEYIHEQGYVHNDIKAQNLLLGHGRTRENDVYLVDFGLVSKYHRDGVHLEYKPDARKAHDGTIEYTSRDAHIGAHSRRSDLEILAYNLVHWMSGTLPWMDNLTNCQYVQNQKNGFMNDIPNFLEKCFGDSDYPNVLEEFLEYSKGLEFDTKPDYDQCRDMFKKALKKCKTPYDGKLDFSAPKTSPNKKVGSPIKSPTRAKAGAAAGKRSVSPAKKTTKRATTSVGEKTKETRGKKTVVEPSDDDDSTEEEEKEEVVQPKKRAAASVGKKTKASPKKRATTGSKKTVVEPSDEEDDVTKEDEEEEVVQPKKRATASVGKKTKTSPKNGATRGGKKTVVEPSDDEDDDVTQEDEEEEIVQPKKRSTASVGKKTKTSPKNGATRGGKKTVVEPSDEEDDDVTEEVATEEEEEFEPKGRKRSCKSVATSPTAPKRKSPAAVKKNAPAGKRIKMEEKACQTSPAFVAEAQNSKRAAKKAAAAVASHSSTEEVISEEEDQVKPKKRSVKSSKLAAVDSSLSDNPEMDQFVAKAVKAATAAASKKRGKAVVAPESADDSENDLSASNPTPAMQAMLAKKRIQPAVAKNSESPRASPSANPTPAMLALMKKSQDSTATKKSKR